MRPCFNFNIRTRLFHVFRVCVGFVVAVAVICKLCATHGTGAGKGARKDDVVEVLNESSLKCC